MCFVVVVHIYIYVKSEVLSCSLRFYRDVIGLTLVSISVEVFIVGSRSTG